MYIVSQVIETVSLIITLVSYHFKKKEKIFKVMIFSNILDMTHYLFLTAYSGFATKLIALIRNIFIVQKEHHKKLNSNLFLFIFIISYMTLAFLIYTNIFSIFPIIAAVVYLLVVWNGNELKVKRIAFICYFFWLIYNISVLSIVGILSTFVALVSTYFAYSNAKKEE